MFVVLFVFIMFCMIDDFDLGVFVVEYGIGMYCFCLVIGSLGEFGLFCVLGEVFGVCVDVILVWYKYGIGELLCLF